MERALDLQLNVVDENGCELTGEGPHLFQTTDTIRYVNESGHL